jgi:Spy/CpxP family protein refolding chaperone
MSRVSGRFVYPIAAMAIVLAAAQVAEAQREGGGRRGGRGMFGRGFGVSSVQLAAEIEDVQTTLNLTDEQKEKVGEINDELREARRETFRGGGQDFRAAREEMEKLNADASAKLAEVLDENQNKRLMGITIQVNGASALNEPAIAKELNVTDEQKESLNEARRSNRESMQEAFEELQDLSGEERRTKARELRDEADKKVLAVLTSDQQAKFEELKGEPVEVDLSELRGFGGGRGGREGRGDGEGRRGGRGRDRDNDEGGQAEN